MFGIMKMGRVLRLNKIIQYLNVTEDVKASMKLFKIVFFLTIYIHLYGCLWWFLVIKDKEWVPYMYQADEDFYFIYHNGLLTEYLVAVHTSVQVLLGGDIGPRDSSQTIIATVGVFMGAIINANIFGELAVILASMGKTEKNFASFFSASNTAMINLELPLKVQQNVRDMQLSN